MGQRMDESGDGAAVHEQGKRCRLGSDEAAASAADRILPIFSPSCSSSSSSSSSSTSSSATPSPSTTRTRGSCVTQRTNGASVRSAGSLHLRRHGQTSLLLTVVLLILSSCSLVASECDADLDALYCDFKRESGHGFRGEEKWDLECFPDEINVIQGSNKRSAVGPVNAIFSDGMFTYLVQGRKILVTQDPSLDTFEHEMETHDLLSGYNKTIVAGFFHQEQVFVFDGSQFAVFTQRIFRANGQPAWSFRRLEDSKRSLTHDKLAHLKSSLVVPIPGSEDSDLILLLSGKEYYKMSIGHCLPQEPDAKKFKDMCFWPQGAKPMANLLSCVWISWKMLILILVISLLALLITCYVCCLLICYRRHRKSGTFKHEHQDCCRDEDHFLEDHAFCKETHKLNPTTTAESNGKNGAPHLPLPSSNGKNGLNGGGGGKVYPADPDMMDDGSVIVDGFADERMSIDLNEQTYKQ